MTEPTPVPPRQSPMAPSAADLLGTQEVLTIQDLGHTAGFAGESPLTCPWKTASEPGDVARRDMWNRGYAAGRTDLRIAKEPSPPPRQSPR
jgi:ribosome modulation factor